MKGWVQVLLYTSMICRNINLCVRQKITKKKEVKSSECISFTHSSQPRFHCRFRVYLSHRHCITCSNHRLTIRHTFYCSISITRSNRSEERTSELQSRGHLV